MSLRTTAVALLLLATTCSHAYAQTAQQIVDSFFPTTELPVDSVAQQRTCLAVAATDGSGAPTSIVAGYSNTKSGAIKLLAKNTGGNFVVADSVGSPVAIDGRRCAIDKIDLTGDSVDDFFVSFGDQAFALKIASGLFVNLTPMETVGGEDLSRFVLPSLCDLKHDGTKQVCTGSDDRLQEPKPMTVPARIFSNSGAQYSWDRDVLAVVDARVGYPAFLQRASFGILADSVGPYVIEVVNGDASGLHRVSSGSVSVNSVEVIGSLQLDNQIEFVQENVTATVEYINELHVEVSGNAGDYCYVIVRDSSVRGAASGLPPAVSLLGPQDGSQYVMALPAELPWRAEAFDDDGIDRVELWANDVIVSTARSAANAFVGAWSNVAAGTYTLTAVAYDTTGAKASSTSATITVTARTNVAAAANGATVSASSIYDYRFPASSVIDGDRKGLNWENGGGWSDGNTSYPDWLEIQFAASKTISEVHVFNIQDSYSNPVTPTPGLTYVWHGLIAFRVEYWNGTAWVTIPGASVTANNFVWRPFRFQPITTSAIRLVITSANNNYSRVIEIEAY